MNIKADIEIAQAAEPKPIYEVARLAEIDEKLRKQALEMAGLDK